MKINNSDLTITAFDSSSITGTIDGIPVKFEKRIKQWNVVIAITIDGILMHDDTPSEDEINEFNRLMDRAFIERSNAYAFHTQELVNSNAFRSIFQ